jgi:hypothetical protein
MASLRPNHAEAKVIHFRSGWGNNRAVRRALGAAATLVKSIGREPILSTVQTVPGK